MAYFTSPSPVAPPPVPPARLGRRIGTPASRRRRRRLRRRRRRGAARGRRYLRAVCVVLYLPPSLPPSLPRSIPSFPLSLRPPLSTPLPFPPPRPAFPPRQRPNPPLPSPGYECSRAPAGIGAAGPTVRTSGRARWRRGLQVSRPAAANRTALRPGLWPRPWRPGRRPTARDWGTRRDSEEPAKIGVQVEDSPGCTARLPQSGGGANLRLASRAARSAIR